MRKWSSTGAGSWGSDARSAMRAIRSTNLGYDKDGAGRDPPSLDFRPFLPKDPVDALSSEMAAPPVDSGTPRSSQQWKQGRYPTIKNRRNRGQPGNNAGAQDENGHAHPQARGGSVRGVRQSEDHDPVLVHEEQRPTGRATTRPMDLGDVRHLDSGETPGDRALEAHRHRMA